MSTKSKSTKSLDTLIKSFGKQNQTERHKTMELWGKAKEDYMKNKTSKEPFNPTTMDYKTYTNYRHYLQLTLIDELIDGNQQDFIPTQNYEQELRREFRRKGVDGSIVFEGNEKRINKELEKIKLRDEYLSSVIHFLDTIECEHPADNSSIKKSKSFDKLQVTKLW